jgi:NAD(P)-dependent dehydrogenase (short-subunit alcohol dehydrogenase family)
LQTVPDGKPAYYLDENASYLVAGGLGGIGRSISAWMVSRGAKNLILLNRSGTKNPEAAELVTELEAQGCKILAPPCDVTKEETLAAVLKEAQETMPPIKGVIQGSMVLRDQIFENMPLEDFKAVTRPKVQGSWNLHSLCPKDLDFFICLASGSGIAGNRGQANYAVGKLH